MLKRNIFFNIRDVEAALSREKFREIFFSISGTLRPRSLVQKPFREIKFSISGTLRSRFLGRLGSNRMRELWVRRRSSWTASGTVMIAGSGTVIRTVIFGKIFTKLAAQWLPQNPGMNLK
jgi:hypothetical protein